MDDDEQPPGHTPKTFRRTDRTDAPHYLARYSERRSTTVTRGSGTPPPPGADDANTPLYLRRFRDRQDSAPTPTRSVPLEFGGERFSPEYAAVTRSHEIIPEERRDADTYVTEIRIIRHGITQGYSTDAGLTPMGAWQAHQRGQALARTLREWPNMRIVCADTNRARQTAEQIHRGLLDGLDQYGRDSHISPPEAIDELKNFQVWTPDGIRDITASFRKYQAEMEKLERMAAGDRPRWLVEIDRFYRTQLGGADPIQQWLTIPLMYFESPQSCVRRFWKGFLRLVEESPGQRIIAATHSGPIRAFATWAHGYDPGEPVNTEEVVVRIKKGGRTATVSYRNRVTEVNVPPVDEIPDWNE
jgi:broad specificity phosphatase PhoE